MSFVTEQMMSSIEELLDSLKAASDSSGLEAMPPVVVFKENKEDAKANVTMFDDKEEDNFEEALIRTFYKVHTHGVEKAHWIGVAMESYGVLKDGVLVEQSADLEPETLEKDFKENPFSDVTEAFTVFLASEDNESEFLFYPYTRDDHGKAVRGKPFIRSVETDDSISHIEAMLLRFHELMRMLRNGEVSLDDED